MGRYTKKFNALKLPCPMSAKTKDDPAMSSYLSWSKGFQEREKRVMDECNRRLNNTLKKAGFAPS